MQFALVSPEITRQFVEREQLRDRAREVHTRASVAIALLDAVLKRHRSVCRCGFGLDPGATHCIACGHDVAERREIEHLESPVAGNRSRHRHIQGSARRQRRRGN